MFTLKKAVIQNVAFANLAKRDVSSKVVIEALKNLGCKESRQNGSHLQLFKDGNRITVPEHGKKDIPEGTLASIIRQGEKAGIKREDFKNAIGRGT